MFSKLRGQSPPIYSNGALEGTALLGGSPVYPKGIIPDNNRPTKMTAPVINTPVVPNDEYANIIMKMLMINIGTRMFLANAYLPLISGGKDASSVASFASRE